MAVPRSPLTVSQGRTFAAAFPVKGSFNPTGWTLRAQVRPRAGSATVLHAWPSPGAPVAFEQVPAAQLNAAGYYVPPGTATVLCAVLRLTPAVSTAWGAAWSTGEYDVEAVNADGTDVVLVARGPISVEREITR